MLEQHLNQLIQDLKLEPLASKDEKGFYSIPLNPSLKISFRELDPGVYLYSPIGPCPMEKREEFLIHVMKANFLGIGTGGNVIALDPEEKFLTLSSALPYDINYKTFKETVEDFGNFVDYWRDELERHRKEIEENRRNI